MPAPATMAAPSTPNVSTRKKKRIASGTRPQSGLTTSGRCPQGFVRFTKFELGRKAGTQKFSASSAHHRVAPHRQNITSKVSSRPWRRTSRTRCTITPTATTSIAASTAWAAYQLADVRSRNSVICRGPSASQAVTVQVEELAQRPQACWRQRQVLGEPRVAELRRYPAADRAAVDGGR